MLQPEKTSSFSAAKILSLAQRVPQIALAEPASLHNLREEYQDFLLTLKDLPSIVQYKAANGIMRPWAGLFWNEVGKMTTLDGQARFGLLHKLKSVLVSIPVSNADSEYVFSIQRKLHIDQRANLKQDSTIALMAMNFHCEDCCLDIKLFSRTSFHTYISKKLPECTYVAPN